MKYLIDNIQILALIGWFIAFIIHQEWNYPYYLKNALKLDVSKYYKLIDCYPCQTFWITLLLTFSPLASILAFLVAVIIDKLK